MLHGLWGLHGLWCLAMVTMVAQTTPVLMNPTDAIGFDYEIAELTRAEVVRFERRSNAGTTWVDIGIPPIVPDGAPLGWNQYKFSPGAPFDQVTTIEFRACNPSGCGPGSVPFTFVRVSSTTAAPTIAPLNVRRISGTTE